MTVEYPWIEGQAYEVLLLTATGATIDHAIDVAVETPDADLGFYGLMALIGLYVGVIPVAIGMLWLPWLRSVDARWIASCSPSPSACSPSSASTRCSRAPSWPARARPRSAARRWSGSGAAGAYLALAGVDAGCERRGCARRARSGDARR